MHAPGTARGSCAAPIQRRRYRRPPPASERLLHAEDRRFVTALRERSTTIAAAADLIGRFTSMVKDKTPAVLDSWLHEAEASALATFAAGLRRAERAVEQRASRRKGQPAQGRQARDVWPDRL